ncbi:hypothetical protein FGO68_gene17769 [Halteria grandinella]|uniref:Uncharacterized protein n=1 Tax=Halteria grandinella TaxID=5974 RepID=A0A8J8T0Y0_HALGN|nr:hypothetical protein FGO68_gene17769 [Halteria grandinella]
MDEVFSLSNRLLMAVTACEAPYQASLSSWVTEMPHIAFRLCRRPLVSDGFCKSSSYSLSELAVIYQLVKHLVLRPFIYDPPLILPLHHPRSNGF